MCVFFVPEVTGAEDLKARVDLDKIDVVEEGCCYRSPESGCVNEFTQLASIIMKERNLNIAETAEEALIQCILKLSNNLEKKAYWIGWRSREL